MEEVKITLEQYKKMEARRLTYRLPDLPRNFDFYNTAWVRDIYNSIIIDEKIVVLNIKKEELKIDNGDKGQFSLVYSAIEGDIGE